MKKILVVDDEFLIRYTLVHRQKGTAEKTAMAETSQHAGNQVQ